MARLTLSSLVSSIVGSVQGSTFQNSASGQVMRRKPIPKKSFNNSQMNIKLLQSQLNFKWAALTEAQRLSWAGKVNHQYKTGKQAFLGTNFYLLFHGFATLSVPAYNVTPTPIFIQSSYVFFTSLYVLLDTIVDSTNYLFLIKASYPVGSTVQRARANMRLLPYVPTDTAIQVINTTYRNTLHVVPLAGMKIWYSVAYQNKLTGDVSAWTTQLVTIT